MRRGWMHLAEHKPCKALCTNSGATTPSTVHLGLWAWEACAQNLHQPQHPYCPSPSKRKLNRKSKISCVRQNQLLRDKADLGVWLLCVF